MDEEKTIAAKLTEVIGKAATSVKNVVSHVVDTASNAAQHAMEVNAEKISRIPPARPDPEQVAGATNEQLYIPEAADVAAMPMPLAPAVSPPKKKRAPKQAAGRAANTIAVPSPARNGPSSAGSPGAGSRKPVKEAGKKPKR